MLDLPARVILRCWIRTFLTVLLVGMLGPGEVEKFKRTRTFTTEDVEGLEDLLGDFRRVCITPHVAAETSNLLDGLKSNSRDCVFAAFADYVAQIDEQWTKAEELVRSPVYYKLGITDACLFKLASGQDMVLITVDLPLYHYALGHGVRSINFNHLREQWLG